jgi:hypothetical protein
MVISISVIVPPGPVFFLLLRRESAEIYPIVAMSLNAPAPVVGDLFAVPLVIVGVIRVVDAIVVTLAGHAGQ